MKNLKKIIYILTPHERKSAIMLLGMILVMAFLDMLGVASIMPFIAVLANPDIIETNAILNKVFKGTSIIGIETDQQFIFILGIAYVYIWGRGGLEWD